MRQRFLFIFTIFLLPLGAQAQRAEWLSIGWNPVFGRNSFSSDGTLPVATPPNPYSDVSGTNFWPIGVNIYWAPFFKNPSFLKNISFGFNAAHEPISRTFESENSTVTLVNGVRVPIIFTHSVVANFTTIPFDLTIYTSFFKDISITEKLSFLKNISIGLSPQLRFLTGARYRKSQRINNPGIDFLEGGNSRTEYDEDIAGKNPVLFGFGTSLQLPIRLSTGFFLKPEISYTFGFTNVAETLPWKISGYRAGIGLEYAAILAPKEVVKDTIIQRDTTLQLAAFNSPDTNILLKTDFRDTTFEDDNFIRISTSQNEFYTHFTPNPAPLLLAEMRVRFLKARVETEFVKLFVSDSLARITSIDGKNIRTETDTLHFAEFPVVRFYPEITSEAGVASWQIEIAQQGKVLKTFKGRDVSTSAEWDLADETDPVKIAREPLDYSFYATDSEGQQSDIQRGKITFELQKKENPPGAQIPVAREEFYISPDFNSSTVTNVLKKRLLKNSPVRIIIEDKTMNSTAQDLANLLKIPVENIFVEAVNPRFKTMIAVIVQR
ncbi:MAG: hypothetical protein V4642_08355 [Bacteroidota bacterium]